MACQTAKFQPVPLVLDALLATDAAAGATDAGALPSQRTLSVSESARLFLQALVGYFAADKIDALGACEVGATERVCICLPPCGSADDPYSLFKDVVSFCPIAV